jgi:hypothetical protein
LGEGHHRRLAAVVAGGAYKSAKRRRCPTMMLKFRRRIHSITSSSFPVEAFSSSLLGLAF